jgi:hypothetical protein
MGLAVVLDGCDKSQQYRGSNPIPSSPEQVCLPTTPIHPVEVYISQYIGCRYAIVVYTEHVKGKRYYREVEVRNSEWTDD